MNSVSEFHPWSPSHVTVIFLTIGLPFLLALIVHRTKSRLLERSICFALSALLLINFFAAHSGIIIGIVFLMLIYGFRPRATGILRTFAWTEIYFVVAFTIDLLTGENYGFLLHKPEAASLLNFLSDSRPLYLLEFHGLAFLFFCALYAPFAIVDLGRKLQTSPTA